MEDNTVDAEISNVVTASPKPQEKTLRRSADEEDIEEQMAEHEPAETGTPIKKKSSSSSLNVSKENVHESAKKKAPSPPPKPTRTLLTTDAGEDMNIVDDEEEEQVGGMLVPDEPRSKPVNSLTKSILGRFTRQKPGVRSMRPRTSFMSIFKPRASTTNYDSINPGGRKGSNGYESVDSVTWRRKESQQMTRSLKLDMDIYQYLKERAPSVDEEDKSDGDDSDSIPMKRPVSKAPIKPPVPKKQFEKKGRKMKSPTTSNLLVEGGVRQATQTPAKEIERRKKRGLFGRFGLRGIFSRKSKKGKPKKKGFAARLMSRMSWGSFQDTTADEMRLLLDATTDVAEEVKAEEKGEFRKDSDDTDLSLGSDIDDSLLVKGKPTEKIPLDDVEDDRAGATSRLSKIFDDGEDEEENEAASKKDDEMLRKKSSFLGTELTKSTKALKTVAAVGTRQSNELIKAEKEKTKVDKAFSLNNKKPPPNVKVVNTAAKSADEI